MKTAKAPKRRYYDLEDFFFIDYSIHSQLGEIEMGRYILDITGSIMAYEDEPLKARKIGSIQGAKVLIGNARKDEEPMIFIWDWEQYLCDMSAKLWDYEEEEFLEYLGPMLKSELTGEDLLILNFIEIAPEFRNKDLGKHVIKDFYNNFISGCALFVANFNNFTAYDYLQKHGIEENKARDYFIKQLGFQKFKIVTDDYLLLNPNTTNARFDAIELI